MLLPALLHAGLPLLVAPAPVLAPHRQDEPQPRELFLTHCAACHGEAGDGRGTTALPRPARSFTGGGFSYGNTRDALLRTVTHGIPGTPMPGFAEALSDDQRAALVGYVLSLGPPFEEVAPAETVLAVGARPQVVRGYLPPVVDGAPGYPRGLLVGMPTGTTFEYRADDLRLVAVRQGEFVERRDWTNRGGNPLRPLGRITWLVAAGRPGAAFADADGAPLVAKLRRTTVDGARATVRYELRRADGTPVATVDEEPRSVSSSVGAGFARRLRIEAAAEGIELQARLVPRDVEWALDMGWEVANLNVDAEGRPEGGVSGRALFRREAQPWGFLYAGPAGLVASLDHLRWTVEPDRPVEVEVVVAALVDDTPETLDRFAEETR